MKTNLIASVLTIFAAAPVTVSASPLGVASDYSVFVFNTANIKGSSIGGSIAAGGSASFSNVSVGTNLPANSGRYDIVVGGALSFGNGQISNGSAISGGAAAVYSFGIPNGKVTSNAGFTAVAQIVDFAATAQSLKDDSQRWDDLAANGTAINQWGGYILSGTDSSLNIFDLDASLLDAVSYMNISVPSTSTVIFNIHGATAGLTNMGFNGLPDAAKVLFNFVDATSLKIAGVEVQGTILAPNATVNFGSGNIKGQLIANSLLASNSGTSFQGKSFNGALPEAPVGSDVPEPQTYALAAFGLAAIGYFRRKK